MSNITTDFVNATKKIAAEVRAVLATLHVIRDDVRVMRDQVVSKADKEETQQQADQTNEEQAKGISRRGELLNVDETNANKTNGKGKIRDYLRDLKENCFKAIRKPKFFVEIAALLGLALYTCETHRTNNLTWQALNNSKKQFEQDQRPLIWASSIVMVPLEGGAVQRIKFDIFFANYGKSPAVSFIGRGKIFVGPYSLQRAEWWIRDLGKERFGDTYIGGTTVVMPGIPADPSKPVGGYTTIQTDMLMSEQIKDALTRDDYIVVVDRQQYFDIVGNFYWSDMCWTHLATGATKACPHNNEVH